MKAIIAGATSGMVMAAVFIPVLSMVLFVIALFHHAQLGVHEVIEDYVHGEKAKVASLVAVKFVAALFGASCVLATLRVSFGG